jgi:hypothetical protein
MAPIHAPRSRADGPGGSTLIPSTLLRSDGFRAPIAAIRRGGCLGTPHRVRARSPGPTRFDADLGAA